MPLLTQLTGILGQLGSIAAAYPLVALLHGTSWPATFLGAAATGLLVAVLVLRGAARRPAGHAGRRRRPGWPTSAAASR